MQWHDVRNDAALALRRWLSATRHRAAAVAHTTTAAAERWQAITRSRSGAIAMVAHRWLTATRREAAAIAHTSTATADRWIAATRDKSGVSAVVAHRWLTTTRRETAAITRTTTAAVLRIMTARRVKTGAVTIMGTVAAGVLVLGATASADPAPNPRLVTGNVTTCAGAGLPGSVLFGSTGYPSLPGAGSGTVSADGTTLAVTINAGFTATGVVVKGGPNTYVYDGPFVGAVTFTGLISPSVGNGNTPQISHWFVCGGLTPPPTSTPPLTPTPPPTSTPPPSPSPSTSTSGTLPPDPSATPSATTSSP